jgi:RHS repeat-associated protein
MLAAKETIPLTEPRPLTETRVRGSALSGTAALGFESSLSSTSQHGWTYSYDGIASGQLVTYKFAQTYRDSDSGLDYARTRYYASGVGRFMTADSVGGHPKTPQTWNLYAYSDSDPVNMFDPQGRDGCSLDGVQVSCCLLTESKKLGRRRSFDPDPMRRPWTTTIAATMAEIVEIAAAAAGAPAPRSSSRSPTM